MKQKTFLILTLLSAATFTAQAKINTQALQACSTIKNDQNRLLCYDKAIAEKPLKDDLTTEVPVTSEDFGLEHKDINGDRAQEIRSVVGSIKKTHYGKLIITLNNNQQWRQVGSDRMFLKEGDKIVIARGVFNSFLLAKEGKNSTIRVTRIQ
ncbi:hypothetical protein GCM10008107_20180 [Psychrosphaera saromensis]|uniref:Pilus assembly protein PilP n=1 Tax=Psychrosphaera saromensis TaxID=716813 RepID=A0A2S7USK2_9GAMM|nr:hypothetical protein [Psychrosphaera saromensis]PQJ52719.1 hypothetical protein BTO11_02975 [Psychrosphaera saromensis]GHB70684.1 hypothetical protein GCM10008107_20180 [Psychrosphaera saromensis]GLQ13204.1 hypothetical protein GCM10007917_06590 [Psychrosphaera saromensis]